MREEKRNKQTNKYTIINSRPLLEKYFILRDNVDSWGRGENVRLRTSTFNELVGLHFQCLFKTECCIL